MILSESADLGRLLLVDGGMLRYHQRRDGVCVIREILVLPSCRRKGIGKGLVREILSRAGDRPVQARCPEKYAEANLFWAAMAFARMEEKDGIL